MDGRTRSHERTRYLEAGIRQDALATAKMAFISGPRQVGKTTLGLHLIRSAHNVFNWDTQAFRKAWARDAVKALDERESGPVLLDEIHKDRRWKQRLKGLYDLHGHQLPIVVTGSARLDLFRRGGDSLQGRYLPYRLHPFSVGERARPPEPDFEALLESPSAQFPWDDLMSLGMFPEPLLGGNVGQARRWSRLRQERLVFEDVRDLRQVRDLQALRVLTDLLPDRVGSLLSINSLREDVGVAYATVRDWVHMLEALYHCFLIRPFAGDLKRTLKADPKLYLYDVLPLKSNGARRENLAALHLLKACHYWTDLARGEFELRFFRTRDGKEVDFVVTRDEQPWLMVECKSDETRPSRNLVRYAEQLGCPHRLQLVDRRGYHRRFASSQVRVIDYERFFQGTV